MESFGDFSKNGKTLKTFKADSPVFGTPFPFEDNCFFGSIQGKLYMISKYQILDSIQLNGKVFSSPKYQDSTIYVGCRDDNIYAITVSL